MYIHLSNNVYHRNNESIYFQLDIQITHYDNILPYCTGLAWPKVLLHRKSPDRMFYFTACHVLLSKNCVERDYSLISSVLAMVKLVNMSCDKILNEVSFVYGKMWK